MIITINGIELQFKSGETVLQVARRAGIDIPHLCSLDWAPSPSASCRMCVIEVEGSPKLQTSCTLLATDGMVVHTHTPRLLKARRAIVELLVANHPQDCLVCHRAGSCELADLARELGARPKQYVGMKKDHPPTRARANGAHCHCRALGSGRRGQPDGHLPIERGEAMEESSVSRRVVPAPIPCAGPSPR